MRAGLMGLVVAVVVVTTTSKQKSKIEQLSVDYGSSSGYNNSIGNWLQELQALRTGIFVNRRLGCNTQPRPALPARAAEQERDASTCVLHRM